MQPHNYILKQTEKYRAQNKVNIYFINELSKRKTIFSYRVHEMMRKGEIEMLYPVCSALLSLAPLVPLASHASPFHWC